MYTIFFFLLGTILASFYGVVSSRLPLNKSIIKPNSHCDNCNHMLSWWELIPILSYIILRGKCRKCGAKIPITTVITELFLGVSFTFFYLYYGFTYELLVSLVLISLFDIIFLTDIKYMIILDSPLIAASVMIFVFQIYFFNVKTALLSVLYGIITFLIMLLIGALGKLMFKKDALGGGDIKLAFVFGLTLGLYHSLIALILSCFLALPYAVFSMLTEKTHVVPFGPFLISALCLVFFFYDKFNWIVNLL